MFFGFVVCVIWFGWPVTTVVVAVAGVYIQYNPAGFADNWANNATCVGQTAKCQIYIMQKYAEWIQKVHARDPLF